MQAAQTITITHPVTQQARIDPNMPMGMDLWAFNASSEQWITESNAPMVHIAGFHDMMALHPIGQSRWFSHWPKMYFPELKLLFLENPTGTAMRNSTIKNTLTHIENV